MADFSKSTFITVLIFQLVLPVLADGQVRQSANYQIERDSLNVGGGLGTSDNYQLQDTVGEIATGYSASDNYAAHAGFQQSLEGTFISISAPSDLTMASISGLTGGVSTSSASWKVTTNNSSGYSLKIKSNDTPAMKSSLDAFDDYDPTTAAADFDFSIDAAVAEFGFSPSGSDIVSRFKDDGGDCGVGSSDTLYKCWDGLSSLDQEVVQSGSPNHPVGSTTTINFQAESGNNKILTSGAYSATIIMTAVTL